MYPYHLAPTPALGDQSADKLLWQHGESEEMTVWVPVCVPVLVPVDQWGYPMPYPQAGHHSYGQPWLGGQVQEQEVQDPPREEETRQEAETPSESASQDTCQITAEDSMSDASTDVGDDEDLAEDFEDEPILIPVAPPLAPRKPSVFAAPSRQQRLEQLNRVIAEYCSLKFDDVDATSQEGLVFRMLTILKSLRESTSFSEGEIRSQEKRLVLLGLGEDDEKVIEDVACRAEECCNSRAFRAAFKILTSVNPRLINEAQPSESTCSPNSEAGSPTSSSSERQRPMTSEEIEEMKRRRLEKRMRQRAERREQRRVDRRSGDRHLNRR